jgi:arginine decarboxylase
MRALDVNEIHGYRADLGLRVFTPEALAAQTPQKRLTAAKKLTSNKTAAE